MNSMIKMIQNVLPLPWKRGDNEKIVDMHNFLKGIVVQWTDGGETERPTNGGILYERCDDISTTGLNVLRQQDAWPHEDMRFFS